ncbi:hypothetical protein QNN00_24030 [Bacillus velezensis]|nr:hypothetical protein [Bacillus velezensis]
MMMLLFSFFFLSFFFLQGSSFSFYSDLLLFTAPEGRTRPIILKPILKPIIMKSFPLVRFTADHTFPSYAHAPFIL